MIILTGGGGMIGSMIAWHLNTQMNFDDFVIVDDLINEQQENNFNKRKFIEYIAKDDLEKGPGPRLFLRVPMIPYAYSLLYSPI